MHLDQNKIFKTSKMTIYIQLQKVFEFQIRKIIQFRIF